MYDVRCDMRASAGRQRCGRQRGHRGIAVWRHFAALLVLAIGAAACVGGGGGGAAADTAATDDATKSGGREIIRFLFSADPVWDYLKDTGILKDWEEEHHVRVVDTEAWDEFTYFAAGRGDIVSTGSYEVPLLENETGVKTVTFGKYNHVRNLPLARPGEFRTFEDVPDGAKVAGSSLVGSAVVWGMLIEKLHGRTLSTGAGDLEQVVAENEDMPGMVVNGEIDVCWCNPEAAVEQLRSGELEPMYGGRNAQDLYQEITDSEHRGLMSNVFVATEEWYEANPDLAVAFLELWQEGVDLWNENLEEIVGIYPQHFEVETEEDIEFIQNYLLEKDWFVDEVALTDEWIAGETQMYELLKETGYMDEAEEIPRYEALTVSTD